MQDVVFSFLCAGQPDFERGVPDSGAFSGFCERRPGYDQGHGCEGEFERHFHVLRGEHPSDRAEAGGHRSVPHKRPLKTAPDIPEREALHKERRLAEERGEPADRVRVRAVRVLVRARDRVQGRIHRTVPDKAARLAGVNLTQLYS